MGGYTVEYHQNNYDGNALGRLWTSYKMPSIYKPFLGVIINLFGVVEWNMRNSHPKYIL